MKFIISRTSTQNQNQEKAPYRDSFFDERYRVWFIDLHSISQLMRIAKSNDSFNPGEIVVSYGSDLPGYLGHIEIYDNYRERPA